MSKQRKSWISRRSFIEKSMIGTAGLAISPAYVKNLNPDLRSKQAELNIIELNQPDTSKGMPVMQALKNRRSIREVQSKKLSPQHLSELLWASDGVNRKDGKRTSPSAFNVNLIETYAILEEGIYYYDPEHHRLVQRVAGDYRKLAGEQDFTHRVPLNLVYICNLDNMNTIETSYPKEDVILWAAIEAGHQAQNVYLYCASEGLGTVIRASMNVEEFSTLLHFNNQQIFISIQTVGYKD
ncbi:SagB/ThcOx family dehydrogenase [Bacteroidota bacterium]